MSWRQQWFWITAVCCWLAAPAKADRYDDLINQWMSSNASRSLTAYSTQTDAMYLAWHCMNDFHQRGYAYEVTKNQVLIDRMYEALNNNIVNGTRANPLGQQGYLVTSDYKNPDATWWGDGIEVTGESGRIIEGVMHWVYLVKTNAALQGQYGGIADQYLAKMESLLQKWLRWVIDDTKDAPSDYHYPGSAMVVEMSCSTCTVDPYKDFKMSAPNNKMASMGMAYYWLYRTTGNPVYRQVLKQLALRFKSVLIWQNNGEYYSWHYFDPFWNNDFTNFRLGGLARHGSWIEHRGGYGDIDLKFMAACYRLGIVFGRTDLDRFVKTNRDIMYNGGDWLLNDGSVPPTDWYGSLYTPLCPYDATGQLADIGYSGGGPYYVYAMKLPPAELNPPDTLGWVGPLEVIAVEPVTSGEVRLTFYNPVDSATAVTPANYSFSRGIPTLGAVVDPSDRRRVTVYTGAQPANTAMKVYVRGVKDIYGNQTFAYILGNQPYNFTSSSVSAFSDRPGFRYPTAGTYLAVTPNPASGRVSIKYVANAGEEPVALCLRTAQGIAVFTGTFTSRPGENEIVWQREDNRGGNVTAGVYFLELANRHRHLVSKVMLVD